MAHANLKQQFPWAMDLIPANDSIPRTRHLWADDEKGKWGRSRGPHPLLAQTQSVPDLGRSFSNTSVTSHHLVYPTEEDSHPDHAGPSEHDDERTSHKSSSDESELSGIGTMLDTNATTMAGADATTMDDSAAVVADATTMDSVGSSDHDIESPAHGATTSGDVTGNISFWYCNWGITPKDEQMSKLLDACMKKSPCQILMISEADKRTADMLQAVVQNQSTTAAIEEQCSQSSYLGSLGHENEKLKIFLSRPDVQWAVLREPATFDFANLVAVRAGNCRQDNPITCLHSEAINHGEFKKDGKTHQSITRILIAQVHMKKPVAFLGRDIVVMVVHLHYQTAGSGAGLYKAHEQFFMKCEQLIKNYGVQVIGGDWNKAVMKVVPQFRSRGIKITTAAWYPWCAGFGQPHADSCAIFIVNQLVQAELVIGEDDLRDTDDFNSGWDNRNGTSRPFRPYCSTRGPGMPILSYVTRLTPHEDGEAKISKTMTLHEKLATFLSAETTDLQDRNTFLEENFVAKGGDKTKMNSHDYKWLRTKEKRADVDLWALNGVFHNGPANGVHKE